MEDMSFLIKKPIECNVELRLTLEQHGFELPRSTYFFSVSTIVLQERPRIWRVECKDMQIFSSEEGWCP